MNHNQSVLPSGPAPAPEAVSLQQLAAALGDTPETVICVHVLRRGLAHAYVAGEPEKFDAAIVENLAFNQDELTGFGEAGPLWQLLKGLHGWSSVEVDRAVARELGDLMATGTGQHPRYLDDVYHVLRQPPAPVHADHVRVLTRDDLPLLQAAQPALRGAGWRSTEELLREGVAAAAVTAGQLVTLAHTSARSDRFADVGVATLPEWRDQGLATAAAALVCNQVLADSQTPVWSTATTNVASLQVAAKLGFREVSRRTYVIR